MSTNGRSPKIVQVKHKDGCTRHFCFEDPLLPEGLVGRVGPVAVVGTDVRFVDGGILDPKVAEAAVALRKSVCGSDIRIEGQVMEIYRPDWTFWDQEPAAMAAALRSSFGASLRIVACREDISSWMTHKAPHLSAVIIDGDKPQYVRSDADIERLREKNPGSTIEVYAVVGDDLDQQLAAQRSEAAAAR